MCKKFESLYQRGNSSFSCPICKAYANFSWERIIEFDSFNSKNSVRLIRAKCTACNYVTVWSDEADKEVLLYPDLPSDVPSPNIDMPDKIKSIYNEAAKVLKLSPRASAALSRLAIDQLTSELSDKKSLNDRIGDLVSKGLSQKIQQSLDIVRIVGNNGVHPGTIDLADNFAMAKSLLELINIIVDNQISQSRRIQEMYDNLPDNPKKAIEIRDQKNNN